MTSEPERQHVRQMIGFLQDRMRSPDDTGEVIVRRQEVEEFARSAGMDEAEAWEIFRALKPSAWQGQYMDESRSEEGEYTSARISWVDLGLGGQAYLENQ
jgi:hypothetical protein